MGENPSPEVVEQSDDYYHVRFRDPDEFDTIRTPDWAANASGSVSEGSEVRTGKRNGSDDWEVESVLISVDEADDEDEAKELAQNVVEKIES